MRVREEEHWMSRAVALAERAVGLTRPNPPVGAVIVRRGRIVGKGHHRRAGGPHAEILALADAGAQACGGVLYVTLEPCSTTGRTPPCTEAVLAAGLKEVVIGVLDPNPAHAGRGVRVLRQAGLKTRVGVCRRESEALVEPFSVWVATGRPWVTLKLAMTLDGRLADSGGRSKWITGAASRARVHALRRTADAIVAGAGTLRADDPSLLPRPAAGRRPYRVIVTGRRPLPVSARVFTDPQASQTWLAVPSSRKRAVARRLPACAAQIISCRATKSGTVSARDLLNKLGARGVLHAVCEGGGRLASDLVRRRLVDEYVLFYGASFLGGGRTAAALAGAGWPLAGRPRLEVIEVERIGNDIMVRARPEAGEREGGPGCLPD